MPTPPSESFDGTLGEPIAITSGRSHRLRVRQEVDPELVEQDVEALLEAMDGWGTNEAAIYAILEARHAPHRAAIEERFQARYGERWLSLRAALHDEMQGAELQRALKALNAGRDPRAASASQHQHDAGKGGSLGRVVRHFVTWYNFGLGGDSDEVDGLPRLRRAEVEQELLPHLRPGDVVLCGNGGGVSHAMMHVGDGVSIHSMATEKTMRGHSGRIVDTVTAPFERAAEAMGLDERKQGVFLEPFAEFFDRFERDTFVVMRDPRLTPETTEAGLRHLRTLLGKPYDWDFVPGNDAYYCTEVVLEFFKAALGDKAPRIGASEQNVVPGLMEREALCDPVDVLKSPDLKPVAWNEASLTKHRDILEQAGGSGA